MRRSAMLLAALLLTAAAPPDPPGVVTMTAEQQRTVKLTFATAERRPVTQPIRVPGTVAFDQDHVAVLRPLAQARVLSLLAQPGDRVHTGQVLAKLDMPALSDDQANLAAARATVQEAATGVAVARDALRRGVILSRDGSLSRAEAEERRLALAQAEATATSARARAAAMQAEVNRLDPGSSPGISILIAPIPGILVSVGVRPGELIGATSGTLTVADLSVVQVIAQIPEASVPLVAMGDPARVRLASGGDRSWDGAVVGLGAELDPRTRSLPARVRLANEDSALRVGMSVTVTLTSDRGRDGVMVPPAAVQRVGGKRVAFTAAGGDRFQSHDLTVGVERPDTIEVRHGLNAGDRVVTQGSFELTALLQKAMLAAIH